MTPVGSCFTPSCRLEGWQEMLSIRQPAPRFFRILGVTVVVSTLMLSGSAFPAADAGGDALTRLRVGNARFVADASEALPITSPRRAALAQGQSPYATVLSCADSRVPPEVIFHTGLGDLFVVRSAAHVTDRAVLATLEYGVERLHTPLLVVMGHESCGIVKAAMDTPSTSTDPNLEYLLKAIRPAVSRSAAQAPDVRLRAAILANVEETINQLLETSPAVKRLAETQQLTLVGAYYELSTGRVHFSEAVHLIPRPAPQNPAHTSSSSPASRVPPAAREASQTTKASLPAATPAPDGAAKTTTSTTASRPAAARVPPQTPSSVAGH
jgi:carbonic anhydrase